MPAMSHMSTAKNAAYKEEDVQLLKQKGPTGCRDWWCLQVRLTLCNLQMSCDTDHE